MAKYCHRCGARMDDDAKFCPSCGTQAEEQQTYQKKNRSYGFDSQYQGGEYQKVKNIFSMPDYTNQFHPQDIANNKFMAILSYLSILALIPFLIERRSPYVRFHAVQGMYLLAAEIAVNVVNFILSLFRVPQYFPGIGVYYTVPIPIAIVQWALGMCTLALMILGIVFAATGKAKDLPLIGKCRKLGWFK